MGIEKQFSQLHAIGDANKKHIKANTKRQGSFHKLHFVGSFYRKAAIQPRTI